MAPSARFGYFATRLQERLPLSSYRRPLLGTSLCGGLTTFSTMQVELLRMIDVAAAERRATALLTTDARIERSGAPITCEIITVGPVRGRIPPTGMAASLAGPSTPPAPG